MRTYELVVLLHPDLEIDTEAPITKIEKLVDNAGGKIIKKDNWGKKRLAYRVNKQDFAVYIYFDIEMDPAKVPAFERALLLTEEVMRHMLVTKAEEAVKPEPKKAKVAAQVGETKEGEDGKEL